MQSVGMGCTVRSLTLSLNHSPISKAISHISYYVYSSIPLIMDTDCAYDGLAETGAVECSNYNQHYPDLQGNVWVVVLASLVMGAMGVAIGGNDVANAW
jgi:hypothetical protein